MKIVCFKRKTTLYRLIARKCTILFFLAVWFWNPYLSLAAERVERVLVIRNHRFEPSVVEVPAGRKIKLVLKNLDATPEEFESYELRREKLVRGKGQVTIFLGPLKAGEYPFFGEFNQKTAQGRVVAKVPVP